MPPLFAEKDRNSLRKEGEGSINYQELDIAKITQKIQMVGAELCNDLKIKERLIKQKIIGKRELGDFYYQFGVQNPYESSTRGSHRKHRGNHEINKRVRQPIRRKRQNNNTYNKESASKLFKRETKPNDLVCFKCGQKGHKASTCFKTKVKQEIQALLESDSESIKEKLGEILNNIHSDIGSDNKELNYCENSE